MTAVPFQTRQPAAQVYASLRRSLQAMERAQRCAVLWFAEIQRRHLYRELGHATINLYAMKELGFSKSRTRDFIRLAGQLDKLPAVKQALAAGDIGYTKAREIVSVATPKTQDKWLRAAKGPRQDLVREVKRVRQAAKVDSGQTELLPEIPTVVAPQELPVRFQVDLTPEQEGPAGGSGRAPPRIGWSVVGPGRTHAGCPGRPGRGERKSEKGPPGAPCADPCPRGSGTDDRTDEVRRKGAEPGRKGAIGL